MQDLKDHIAYVEGGHLEAMLDCRYDRPSKQWQVRVKWLGHDVFEASWEPAADMATNVANIMATFLRSVARGNGNVDLPGL